MAFFAGLVDAVAGGGGLIQVPALFAAYPNVPPATLLSTNKIAAVGGTFNAARKFLQHVSLPWPLVLPAVVAGFIGSLMGAHAVSNFPAEPLRKALPFVLLFLLLYTWFQPKLGESHAPQGLGRIHQAKAVLMGLIIGFYDGFFGPGTGSFLLFGFVRFFGFDFLHASTATKLVNVATNLAAILMLASLGQINWPLGFAMMIANIAGSQFGSRLAIKHGSAFVRKAFLLIVSVLILKSAWNAYFIN
ncbi:TSUP family transporter [Polynucleobacter sp. TSB-Sco08W16]|uniref:sulfite exporter TauE/SafE family protein n=1 Tax=Polynucleobacter sp. TSB-Sco08W16 TaxID=1758374 RepID=UPI001BFE22B2|nr:TSUP family transporter [Polynucleobacter sp. TSB-Sco08W16]QWD74280.1 TSUP family transporter [Polynucleobacter sp. TSB-Sco08W16]